MSAAMEPEQQWMELLVCGLSKLFKRKDIFSVDSRPLKLICYIYDIGMTI